MTPLRVVITGGTGFVGRTLCEHLFRRNMQGRIVVPTRHRVAGKAIQLLPTVDLIEADVSDPRQLASLLAGADALVHLVAVLHGDARRFERLHVQLPRELAKAARAAGVRRVVHVSALGVAADAPSNYLRSKAAGEAVWRDSGLHVSVLRPSVIFGAEDRFTNLFARLQRVFPVLPLAGAAAQFQPVWVGDVAQAIVACLDQPAPHWPLLECAGPEVLTLAQIVQRVGTMAGCARPILRLPEFAGMLQAAALSMLPGEPLMSRDNVLSMRVPNLASGHLPDLASLGIAAAGLDTLTEHFAPR